MTSLKRQLESLRLPEAQFKAAGESKRRKSILFSEKEAAGYDRQTIYEIGVSGLKGLENLHPAFEDFHDSLFSKSSRTFQRLVQDRETNTEVDKIISSFLLHLSPFFNRSDAHKALEWLVCRYEIHLFNVDALMMCILPHHHSKPFIRCLQLLDFQEMQCKQWAWLENLAKESMHLTQAVLVNHAKSNPAFLAFVCDAAFQSVEVFSPKDITEEAPIRQMMGFYSSVITMVIVDSTPSPSETIISTILPHLSRGLRSKVTEMKAATYRILQALVINASLRSDLVESLVNSICKHISPRLSQDAVCLLSEVYAFQEVSNISKKAFKHLVRLPTLRLHLQRLCESMAGGKMEDKVKMLGRLLWPLLRRLVPAAFRQASLGTMTSDSSDDEHASPVPPLISLLHDLMTFLAVDTPTATRLARLILEQFVEYTHEKDPASSEYLNVAETIKSIMGLFEGRFSEALDLATDELLSSTKDPEARLSVQRFLNLSLLPVSHQVLGKASSSLVLSLNHHHASVRLEAVQHLLQQASKTDDKEFVSNSLLSRLQDDSLAVLKAILKTRELPALVLDSRELQACLLTLVANSYDGGIVKKKWSVIWRRALKVLCDLDTMPSDLALTLALTSLFVVPGCLAKTVLSGVSEVMNTSLASDNKVLQHVRKAWLPQCQELLGEGKLVEDEAAVTLNLLLAEAVVAAAGKDTNSLVGEMRGVMERSPCPISLAVLLLLVVDSAIQAGKKGGASLPLRLTQISLLGDLLKVKAGLGKAAGSLQDTTTFGRLKEGLRRYGKGRTLSQDLYFGMLQSAILSLAVPKTLQKLEVWCFSSVEEDEEALWVRIVIRLLSLLCELASNSNTEGHAKDLIQALMKGFDDASRLRFLSLLWSQPNNDQAAALGLTQPVFHQSLQLGRQCLESLAPSQASSLLSEPLPVVVPLLVLARHSVESVRKEALSMLRVLLDKDKGAAFSTLLTSVLQYQEEMVNDPDFAPQVIVRCLGEEVGAEPAKKRSRKSSASAAPVLQSVQGLLRLVQNAATPTFISVSVLDLLHLYEDKSFTLGLVELGGRLLARAESGAELSRPEASALKMLLQRLDSTVAGAMTAGCELLVIFTRALAQPQPLSQPAQRVAVSQIKESFFSSLPDKAVKTFVFESLIQAWAKTKKADVAASFKKAARKIPMDAELVLSVLQPMMEESEKAANTSLLQAKRQKAMKHRQAAEKKVEGAESEESVFEAAEWQQVKVLLEAVRDSRKLQDAHLLISPGFKMLARVLQENTNDFKAEWLKQLLLAMVSKACHSLGLLSPSGSREQELDIGLIIQCLESSTDTRTYLEALKVLEEAARICPNHLLRNIMSFFIFMNNSVVKQDDIYLFQKFQQMLETVIPPIILASKNQPQEAGRSKERGKAAREVEAEKQADAVITVVWRHFAMAYRQMPAHRRVMLFSQLLKVMGGGELWRLLLLLLEGVVERAGDKSRADPDDKTSKTIPQEDLEFMVTMASKVSATQQMQAARKVIGFLFTLPDDVTAQQSTLLRSKVPMSLNAIEKEQAEIFSLKQRSTKQLHHFRYGAIFVLEHLLSSQTFVSQLAEEEEEVIVTNFKALLKTACHHINVTLETVKRHSQKSSSRFWNQYLARLDMLFAKVMSLLPEELFLQAVSGLMSDPLPSMQSRALDVLHRKQLKFIQDSAMFLSPSLVRLLESLTAVLKEKVKANLIDRRDEESDVLGQFALINLKLASRLIGNSHKDLFTEVLAVVCEVVQTRSDSPLVLTSGYQCLAELVSSVRELAIQHMAAFLRPLCSTLAGLDVTVPSSEEDHLLRGLLLLLQKTVEIFHPFISPYLEDIVMQLCRCCVVEGEDENKASNSRRHKAVEPIRNSLPSVVALRVLLPVIQTCFQKMSTHSQECLVPLMQLLGAHLVVQESREVVAHLSPLLQLFLRALDFRLLHPEVKRHRLDAIEGAVVSAFCEFSLRLNEATLKTVTFKLLDWAASPESDKHRLLVFYRLTDGLAQSLKLYFTIVADPIVQNAAEVLSLNHKSRAEPFFGKGKKNKRKSSQLVTAVLDTFSKCFLHDTQKSFLTQERFDTLMPAVIDQLENRLGSESMYEKRKDHLVLCIAHMALAAEDDSQWKQMNDLILQKIHHEDRLVQLATLGTLEAVVGKIGEDYKQFIASTVEDIGRLMSGNDEEVRDKCNDVLISMGNILGENLQKYLE